MSRSIGSTKAAKCRMDPCAKLDAELRNLLEQISAGAQDVESLCQRTGLAVPVVQSDVLRLTMMGRVRSLPNGTIEVVSIR